MPPKSSGVDVSHPSTCTTATPPVGPSRYVCFLLIAAVGCALDLLTKHWIFQWRGPPRRGNVWWIWNDYVGIETSLNTGALFGMGQNQVALFAGISCVAIGAILYWLFVARAAHDWQLTIALGCVFGSILGNLYDRLGLWGQAAVRDWILLRYGELSWPNFNVADSLLVSGAVLLVWHGFRTDRRPEIGTSSD